MEQTSNKQYKKFDIQSIFDLSPPQRVFGLPRALLFRLGLLASFSSTSSSVRVTQSTLFRLSLPASFSSTSSSVRATQNTCAGSFSIGPPRFSLVFYRNAGLCVSPPSVDSWRFSYAFPPPPPRIPHRRAPRLNPVP